MRTFDEEKGSTASVFGECGGASTLILRMTTSSE